MTRFPHRFPAGRHHNPNPATATGIPRKEKPGPENDRTPKIAVIYHSSTGTVYELEPGVRVAATSWLAPARLRAASSAARPTRPLAPVIPPARPARLR